MIAPKNDRQTEEFVVIHPLEDAPEQKMTGVDLGRMPMSKAVRISLLLLRCYLILMFMLLGFHLLDMAHVFTASKSQVKAVRTAYHGPVVGKHKAGVL